MAPVSKRRKPKIESFDLQPGRMIGRHYEIVELLGSGWEGEVYKVRESTTRIERAAKFFYPHRNLRDRSARFYARKLHKLRHCPCIIQYHSQDTIRFRRHDVTFLVSELVEGELLSTYIARQRGKRLPPFQALVVLRNLAHGIDYIHRVREYHGDLHSDNIIIQPRGLHFEFKTIDLFHWGPPRQENISDDVCDLVRIFYDSIGGQKFYSRQPPAVKSVCCGLKRSLMLSKFKSAGQLRRYLDTLEWG